MEFKDSITVEVYVTIRIYSSTLYHLISSDITPAQINNMSWIFRQQSFPHVKDNGTADAKVSQAKGFIAFNISFESGKPKISISRADFSFNSLDLKVHGASIK